MPGENLTRDEARERARLVTTESYEVALDLMTGDETFVSDTTIRFAAEPGSDTFVDLIAPRVREITLNGSPVDVSAFQDARVQLSSLAAQNELRIIADCAYMRTGEGLHRFVDPVDKAVYLYTQFEVIDARRMFACFDQPDLKATFSFTVTAPDDWEVISNSPTPEPEPLSTGTARWTFPATPRMSTYITALVAGPYHVVRDEHRGIPFGVFCRRSLAEHLDAERVIDVTKKGFDYFEELFARPYPFEKYDQLFVPEFNAGAMENAGAVTILEDYVFRSKVTDAAYERRAETILHELAHMWFGDLVTMRWWDDLWLNESFATFASVICQAEATHWVNAWTTFANLEKTWAYRQDQLPSTHPISADIRDIEDVEVNFDGITYAKGASVLKQLVAWVGRDAFVAGVRSYFDRHAWGNTELVDLLSALEETSGRDLSSWAKEWLETAGLNTLRAEFTVDDAGAFTSFDVLQSAPEDHPTLRSHRLAIGFYKRTDDGLVRQDRVELDVVGERTSVPQLIGVQQPDLLLVNDEDLAYTKIRLDPRSAQTLVESIGELTDSLARALCWTAAWDMTRDAELSARDWVTLVRSGLPHEADIGVLQGVVRQAVSALYLFTPKEPREQALTEFADFLLEQANAAAPGSDHQLALFRAFVSIARTNEQLDVVAHVLDGTRVPDGLTVDADLRWSLVHRLVATGREPVELVDEEFERDRTASGERQAASARSAVPTEEAKDRAWRAAVESDELPNALLSATIAGLNSPDQSELNRRLVDRYFGMLEEVWRTRTNDTAQSLVVGLYPGFLVERDIVDRTEAYLAEHDTPPALRRLLLEGADGVRRSLRAQQAYS
ncbi:MAG TPA: aminopeptidase N [Actinomycetes bacterium]|nr:aminopeptidase N [Actinomycetes bacterium]